MVLSLNKLISFNLGLDILNTLGENLFQLFRFVGNLHEVKRAVERVRRQIPLSIVGNAHSHFLARGNVLSPHPLNSTCVVIFVVVFCVIVLLRFGLLESEAIYKG